MDSKHSNPTEEPVLILSAQFVTMGEDRDADQQRALTTTRAHASPTLTVQWLYRWPNFINYELNLRFCGEAGIPQLPETVSMPASNGLFAIERKEQNRSHFLRTNYDGKRLEL